MTVELSGRVTRGLVRISHLIRLMLSIAILKLCIIICFKMVLDRRTDVDTGKNNAVVVDRMDEDIIKERLIRAFKNC